MNGKKYLSLLLALALALSLAVPAFGEEAVQDHTSFDDLKNTNWSWAWDTIDDTIRRGLFVGYDPVVDKDGNVLRVNFGPGDLVTQSVGLTLCARMMVDKEQREAILADRLDQMRQLIPGTASNPDDPAAPFLWFRREAATCLELGIIQDGELETLRKENRLGEPMTKADFAKYLVRAMGLDDFAKGLNADSLPFNDQASIPREYRPYVKLLSTYGVLTGDHVGNFNPNDNMTRAICATMLSRAIVNIQENREVTVDLPRYTTYDWTVGYIQGVTLQDDGSRLVELKSDITGTHQVVLPGTVSIYQHNMKASTTELKVGTFARVCYDSDGQATMVRLTPAGFLSSLSGKCGKIDPDSVTVDGVAYTIDRFTEISAGGAVGDRSVLDVDAGYTTAKLVTNSQKRVLSLELVGGYRKVEGILRAVNSNNNVAAARQTTITVDPFNGGLSTTYTLASNAELKLSGRAVTRLEESSCLGRRVSLRINDEDLSTVEAVEVDGTNQYVQGVLKNYDLEAAPNRVELRVTGSASTTAYEVAENCDITYENIPALLNWLPLDVFVTAEVDGGTVSRLSAWSGQETTTGTLTGITQGDPTVLEITRDDGSKTRLSIPEASLSAVAVLVSGQTSSVAALSTGTDVTVTVVKGEVTAIDATTRAADVTGTLNAVAFEADGSIRLTIRLSDGSTKDYTAAGNATITLDGKLVSDSEIVKARGQVVALITEEGRALSIQLTGAAPTLDTVEGVIQSKTEADGLAVIRTTSAAGEERAVSVRLSADTAIITVAGGKLDSIAQLNVGDSVQVYGSYNASGVFEAKSVIRK